MEILPASELGGSGTNPTHRRRNSDTDAPLLGEQRAPRSGRKGWALCMLYRYYKAIAAADEEGSTD
jgi:hypothetical protein